MQELTEMVGRKLAKGKSPEVIAKELDEELSVVQDVIERMQESCLRGEVYDAREGREGYHSRPNLKHI